MIFNPLPQQHLIREFLLPRARAGVFAGIGLSKTASTLWAFNTLHQLGESKAMLVVAPMRVANLTWPNEIEKWQFSQGLRYERLRENGDMPSGKADIYLTSYERLLKRVKKGDDWVSVPRYPDLSFCDTVVFDELTRAKNPSSDQINSFRPALKNQRRWGLTGTPRPNSLLELFAQVRLLDDGKRLGPSYDQFKKIWFEPEDWNEYKWNPKPDAERRIYERIHDLVITLKSSDYLDIPDTIVEDIEVALPQAAHGIYKQLERELMILLQGKEVVAVNAAVLVNKLLQICGGAIYATDDAGERSVIDIHQSKIVALKRLLLDLKEPALIACNYIHERERICRAIPDAVDASKFKGDIEDAWNSGRIKYLVADPRSLGHGLNLQEGGRNTVWFSPCWSRELFDQLNGRLARKGQEKVPRIYRILCPGTMDDAVVESLRERGDAQTEMMTVLTNFRKQGLTFT
jgi:SNF2 family DNA or RNA helicase